MVKLYIYELIWTDKAITKVASHGLTINDVKEAIVLDPGKKAVMVEDDEHGRRLEVRGTSEGNKKDIIAYLDPVKPRDGVWRIRTAWSIE